MIALSFVVARAHQSQPPFPTTGPQRQEQQSPHGAQASPTKPPQISAAPPSKPKANGNDGKNDPGPSNGKESAPHDWWTIGPSVTQALAAVASAGITVAIYFIYLGQLRVMKHQAVVMRLTLKANRRTIDKMDEIAAGQTSQMNTYIEQTTRSADQMASIAGSLAVNVIQLNE